MRRRFVPYAERHPEARRAPVASIPGDTTRQGDRPANGRSPFLRVWREHGAEFGIRRTWEEAAICSLCLAAWGAVLFGLAVML